MADGEAPTVLILGETGSGKDLVARALHCGDAQASALEHDARAGARPGTTVGARTGSWPTPLGQIPHSAVSFAPRPFGSMAQRAPM